jgi:hypothetical protein
MTATNGILALVGDAVLPDDVDRVAAAAGMPVVHASQPSSRTVWSAAVAVLLAVEPALRCADRAVREDLLAARPDDTTVGAVVRRCCVPPAS